MESAGMAFAIIFTIIVIAFLLVFGFQQLMSFFSVQGEANILKNIDSVESLATSVYGMSEGSSKEYKISSMSDTAMICFVDSENPVARIYERQWTSQNWNPDNMAVIRTKINNNGYNVFYYPEENGAAIGAKINVKGGKIVPAKDSGKPGNFCVKNNMKIKLTNTGLTVEISPVR